MNKFQRLEQKYKENNYYGGEKETLYFTERQVPSRVLISAPHSVKQRRCGRVKPQEFYTGAIAESLAEELQCDCITKGNLNCRVDDDADYQTNCEYRDLISQYVEENSTLKLFVDIHGLSFKKLGTVIDIQTNNGNTVFQNESDKRLVEILKSHGIPESMIGLDRYYNTQSTSTWLYETYCIPSISIHINGAYRWFEGEYYNKSLLVYECLVEWLKTEQFLIDGKTMT